MRLFTASTVDLSNLNTQFGFHDAVLVTANGNRCRTRQSLFDEWHAALRLPYNPDKNWDAFDDSNMQMFEGLGTTEIVIIVPAADQLLQDSPPEEKCRNLRILLEILRDTTGEGMFVNEPDRLDLARAVTIFVARDRQRTVMDKNFQEAGFDLPELR